MNFETALKHVLRFEGGISNHPKDTGGLTAYGITQNVYDGYRANISAPKQPVTEITKHEIEAIYFRQYWLAAHCNKMPHPLVLAVFDFAVHSGVSRCTKTLQRILGVNPDGFMGVITLSAIENLSDKKAVRLAIALCEARRTFLKSLANYPTFKKGWNKRIDEVAAIAARRTDPTPVPADEFDAPHAAGFGKKRLLARKNTAPGLLFSGLSVTALADAIVDAFNAGGINFSVFICAALLVAALALTYSFATKDTDDD